MNNNELNYPVVYAPLTVEKFVGRDSFGDILSEPYCYVTAPAYLLSETKKYNKDGSSRTLYDVVFIKSLEYFDDTKVKGVASAKDGFYPCDATIVESVSESFDKIENICVEKNSRLLGTLLGCTTVDKVQDIVDEYVNNVQRCQDMITKSMQKNPKLVKKIESN